MESTLPHSVRRTDRPRPDAPQPILVVLWSRDEPERVGESVAVPVGSSVLGRLGPNDDGVKRLEFAQRRPGRSRNTGPMQSRHLSREQLRIERFSKRRKLTITNVGRCPLWVDGREVREVTLGEGGVLELQGHLVLGVFRSVDPMPMPAPGTRLDLHPFGAPDAQGLVGESAAAWALREQIAFVAPRDAHVLVRGPSGTGKELVARALHERSSRAGKPMVSRNAATIPDSLADAELFGHVKDYPNPGVPERSGLIGQADGSTLLLDEFGELPQGIQAHLLRVLDEGEYTRLGDSRPRRADLRLVAATNRDDSALKHDVLARFKLTVQVPSLTLRREDIPLIARGLLQRIAREDEVIARRFFPRGDPSRNPRITPGLVRYLVEHPYTTHVRELESMLWISLQQSRGDQLEPIQAPERYSRVPEADIPAVDPNELDPELIQACLDKHDGAQEPVWKELGLSSRHVLTRLVKKHGLTVRGRQR